MSYVRLNLADGVVFNASHVSHIEDGIDDCENQIEEVNESLKEKADQTDVEQNTKDIATNAENIATNTGNIATNADAISELNQSLTDYCIYANSYDELASACNNLSVSQSRPLYLGSNIMQILTGITTTSEGKGTIGKQSSEICDGFVIRTTVGNIISFRFNPISKEFSYIYQYDGTSNQ